MAPSVRAFFRRLSPDAIADVLTSLGANTPDRLDELSAGQRAIAASEAAMDGDARRGKIEAIVSEISALTSRPDLAEAALRSVCDGNPQQLEMLDQSLSLDERCWRVWRRDSKLIDRARNVAMSHHWHDGRFHSAFKVTNPGGLKPDLSAAVAQIQTLIQNRDGGRRAETDPFTYSDLQQPSGATPATVHHIAIYLERAAKYLMEFGVGEAGLQPIIRHEARELAITYNETTGRLDVSGFGVGGHSTLKEIATTFHAEAISGSEIETIKRDNWQLDCFLATKEPDFSPPDGFTSVRVIELRLRAKANATRRASFKTSAAASAYERLRDLGVTDSFLRDELVAGVVLSLKTAPDRADTKPRDVRIQIDWPARRHFDNGSIAEHNTLDAWLAKQRFAPKPS